MFKPSLLKAVTRSGFKGAAPTIKSLTLPPKVLFTLYFTICKIGNGRLAIKFLLFAYFGNCFFI